jgi:hypothetical protein
MAARPAGGGRSRERLSAVPPGVEWPRVGVMTRFAAHVGLAPLTFWETKDVAGARRALPAGAVPAVSLFADNRVGKSHPDWVQVGPDGERATRGGAPYFDWACLCPSRPEVAELAAAWVDEAVSVQGAQGDAPSLRLSDAGFAREGYCRCPACLQAADGAGLALEAYRTARVGELVRRFRARVPGRLYLTLYPDPYPGHLERRFGLGPEDLGPSVDAYVVPLYDLAYATTHWLESLCQGFADRLDGKPWFAELYALGVEEAALRRAFAVAGAYASGVVLAYERDAERLERVAGLAHEGA